jgi:hypothetical protein
MIEHLIQLAAAARLELDEATAAHAHDAAEVERLTARIEQCRNRQREITDKRLAGTATEQETAEFAALNGDIEVLTGLLAEARDCARASEPQRQRAALSRAENELAAATREAEHTAMIEHAREVEQAYIGALQRVWDSAQAKGGARTFGEAFKIAEPVMNLCRFNHWYGLGVRP